MAAANSKEKMYVRGRIISSIPKFVQKNYGKEGYEKWLEAISADAHSYYILPIKNNDWYPLKETLIQPIANVAQLFFKWDLKEASWQMGRFSVESGLNTIFKFFVKMKSAEFFIKKASEFIADAYKPSALEAGEITEKSAILRVTHFPEIDKTTEYRMAGWAQRILELNGCKNVKVEIPKSLLDFKDCTEFSIIWD